MSRSFWQNFPQYIIAAGVIAGVLVAIRAINTQGEATREATGSLIDADRVAVCVVLEPLVPDAAKKANFEGRVVVSGTRITLKRTPTSCSENTVKVKFPVIHEIKITASWNARPELGPEYPGEFKADPIPLGFPEDPPFQIFVTYAPFGWLTVAPPDGSGSAFLQTIDGGNLTGDPVEVSSAAQLISRSPNVPLQLIAWTELSDGVVSCLQFRGGSIEQSLFITGLRRLDFEQFVASGLEPVSESIPPPDKRELVTPSPPPREWWTILRSVGVLLHPHQHRQHLPRRRQQHR